MGSALSANGAPSTAAAEKAAVERAASVLPRLDAARHASVNVRAGSAGSELTAEEMRAWQVRADLIRSIYSHIPKSSLGVLAGSLTVTWGMWGQVAHASLLAWLAAVGAILLWRFVLYQTFPATLQGAEQIVRWQRHWTLSTALHGSVWGSSAFFMYVTGSPEYQALLLVALFAISTAAMPLIVRHLPSLYAFVLPVLLPVIVRLVLEGGGERIALALISALVMYGIFLFGIELHATIAESVRRQYENDDLIAQLTEQKAQAEAARSEADSANRMKTRFLAAASHDLRQPLHALGLFSDSLRQRITAPHEHALAERICESVQALERTFDALLDISRLDAGIVQPKDEPFALQSMFERVLGDCSAEAAAKGLALRVVGTRLCARSDPVLVEQVLRNLVTNAIRYTDRGKVLVGCRRQESSIRVEVWDTGIGIPADKHGRIFDEFYQAQERDRREGLGLGLAIVRRVTKLLHIALSVESQPGCGSVFRFELPACPAETLLVSRVRTQARALRPSLHDAVVLVIDDDPAVLDAMAAALLQWGARAVLAKSLVCALARLPECERYPDAIVSDFRLGEEQNGLTAVARIRHELGLDIPAMIVTGDTAPKCLRTIQASGLRYLPKPVMPDRLFAELQALLQESATPARG